ncbi:MAG: RNA methyltransferase [Bacteroidota bacterium]
MRKLKNEELDRLSLEDYQNSPKLKVVIVLDNIRSMHNIGAAFRTSDAFRVQEILLTGISATPPHREIHKTALGATDSVKWSYWQETKEALEALRSQGYELLAIEQAEQSQSLTDFQPIQDKSYAFIFGNEVFGVEEAAMQMVDSTLEIPQYGTKHSLNVSVSVGVVLWDFFSKARSNDLFSPDAQAGNIGSGQQSG